MQRQRYPVGAVVPVEPWLVDGIERLAQGTSGFARLQAERGRYLVRRFPGWRVFPVRVGRWYRSADRSGGVDDPIGGLWYIGEAIVGAGHWVERPDIVQVLDPGTGRPIAEHLVQWRSPYVDGPVRPDPGTRTLAILGDPRVCGLFAALDGPHPPTVAFGGNRRRPNLKWTVPDIEKHTPRLIGKPYRDYASKDDGPWLVDHPQQPPGGRTRWGRYSGPR